MNRTCVGIAHAAIRSVSHLDLAREWRMPGQAKCSNRKQRGFGYPSPLPPARFSWSTVLLPHALVLASACGHPRGAHPAQGGTRKPSVPGRVHSMAKSGGSQEAGRPPKSNPWLTRGTVESPAKRLLSCVDKELGRAAASNQSPGLFWSNPFAGWRRLSKIQFWFIVAIPF